MRVSLIILNESSLQKGSVSFQMEYRRTCPSDMSLLFRKVYGATSATGVPERIGNHLHVIDVAKTFHRQPAGVAGSSHCNAAVLTSAPIPRPPTSFSPRSPTPGPHSAPAS